ncbi:hypothetical protein Poli38472_003493 [Pythium oligandrum]|uniref:Ysc84 actin-binding domain-containing protein n=1 Tax=Pythium oligandrum TaxID=41045 RepID=A0A8K1FG93_PYTOL|nr:hypothetical protein Poli38472_003493 [Pythium oligandrum]|eukprot:TMW57568.1 hypothetical protein Poli38472_003493 [Pythium oligandrum]
MDRLRSWSNSKSQVTEAISTMEGAVSAAEDTLEHLFNPNLDHDKRIPIDLLHQAQGIAFLTVLKAGFIWTGRVGTGIVISKLPDGRWSAPSAIGTLGMGFGAELGGQLIEFMIILNSEQAVKSFMQKNQISAGANLEFAAGPYGRAAGANANLSASGIAPNYTYSHSKGLFGGVGLQGSAISARSDLNKKFYGREITPTEILTGAVEQPAAASQLYDALNRICSIPPSGTATMLKNKFLSPFLDRMPAAAVGPDIQIVYDHVLATINTISGPEGVEEFKSRCKDYGQNHCTDQEFAAYLSNKFTKEQLLHLIPEVIKLLQDADKRKYLWDYYLRIKSETTTTTNGTATAPSLF